VRQLLLTASLLVGLYALAAPEINQLRELAKQKYGVKGGEQVSQWLQMLKDSASIPERAKLLLVNDFFNQRVRFSTDQLIWGRQDYWATPLETLGNQQGDCEDFSIAKYASLLKLGVPKDKLRLTYVKAKLANGRASAHMVLAYYSSPLVEPLILDNLSFDIMPASNRPDLVPVFSFNSAGLWVGNNKSKITKPETRLSRWRDVLIRMQAEGLQLDDKMEFSNVPL
jgi:predicted transglutaminase-like cysteine proteinase